MLRLVFLLSLALIFSACSTKNNPTYSKRINKTTYSKPTKKSQPSYKPRSNNYITTALYKEYKKWYTTPYKLGGIDMRGIDCSSLIQTIYKDAFAIDLPRTTREQAKKGYKISKNFTREGDLIFFKTGYNIRHAGIIIEKEKFIHTSQKYGVTISSLNNPYWKSRYWQSRRVLP